MSKTKRRIKRAVQWMVYWVDTTRPGHGQLMKSEYIRRGNAERFARVKDSEVLPVM